MKTPDADDLRLAAEWLDAYESVEDGISAPDALAMRKVIEWLLSQAEAQELRKACREAGIPVQPPRKTLPTPRRREGAWIT